MSTVYKGKLNFTKEELTTKYDNITFINKLHISLTFPYANVNDYVNKFVINGKKSLNFIDLNKKTILKEVESSKFVSKTLSLKVEDWIDLIDDDIQFNYNNDEIIDYHYECEYCNIDCTIYDEIPHSIHCNKLELVEAVLKCVLYGLKGGSNFLDLCSAIRTSDPEFILKVSLFCRREFNVRTISNYLLALAASLPQCNIYLKKYFSTCVNLPTDWIEVAQQYMIIANSIKLPAQLRKALISKFKEFNTYQIGKYQNKTLEVDLGSKKIKLSLKSLIRTLHISEPVEHVMCLLGKPYPKSNEEYVVSNLPGAWDPDKAGKRMKVPTPETWETQISINGNKPAVWEKLIDNKKLPYMAMVRNLRNILQANVNDRYHDKVASMISNESKVINGKLLPFQYFTAFKILEEYNEDILQAKEKLTAFYVKNSDLLPKSKGKSKGKKRKISKDPNDKRDRMRKIIALRKLMGRPIIPENIIEKYIKALNKAVEISSTYNIPCIRGRVLILSNMEEEMIYSKFKYGTSKSVKEIIALLTAICSFASEDAEICLVKDSKVSLCEFPKKMKSVLKLSSCILNKDIQGIKEVNLMMEEMITKQRHFDLIIIFDVGVSKDVLVKYTKQVNPSVSIFINNLANEVDKSFDGSNIVTISGFNEHTIKIISEESNGGFIRKVDSIDKRYNLEDNVICFKRSEGLQLSNINLSDDIDQESQLTDINIFISSTFLDMDKERSLINKVIIPAVRKELKRKNISFLNINCIDLRWGVPAHLGYSEQLLKYCIEQVKRCHIFVGILGERYGWIPDDEIMSNLNEIYPGLNELGSHSITHIEYKFAPSDCFKIFFLQPLNEHMPGTNLEEFHSEIKNNELYYEYSPTNLYMDFKDLVPKLTQIICENFVDKNAILSHFCMKHQRIDRQKLVNKSVLHMLKYSSKNIETQKDAIKEVISLLEHDLKIKAKLHNDVKKRDEASNITDKKMIPNKEETIDKCGGIALIEGKAGSGKTFLISALIREFTSSTYVENHHVSKKLNRTSFIWFYDSIKNVCDKNGSQITLFDLLYDIIEFIMLDLGFNFTEKLKNELGLYGEGCDKNKFWRPTDVKSALPVWYALLRIIDMIDNIQITFFLDGLEELYDSAEACTLNWIPLSLSSKIRFVITAVIDSGLSKSSKARNDCVVYEIKSISAKYKRTIIENLLKSQGKCLDDLPFNNHMSEITLKADSDKPKYLKLAINHLIHYATFDKVKETIKSMPSTIDPLIIHSLKNIEKEVPKEICSVFFAFIYHSKSGLRNEDLQKLLSVYFQVAKRQNNFALTRSDFPTLKKASQVSAGFSLYPLMLIKNLSHILLEESREQKIFIKDVSVRPIIKQYCDSVNSQVIHYIISLYYEDLITRSSEEIAYRDIIYHKFHSTMFEECLTILTNIDFVKHRFILGISSGLLEDYIGYEGKKITENEKWINVCQNEKFINFKIFVNENFVLLSENPELFLQQVFNEPLNSFVRQSYHHLLLSSYEFNDTNKPILQFEIMDRNKDFLTSSVMPTNNVITYITSSSKMKVLVLGYDNGLIQLYQSSNFQIISNLRKHALRINGICIISSSKKMISVGEDNKVLIWSSKNGSLIQELNGHSQAVTDCAFCEKADLMCTVGLDSQCILWKQDCHTLHHTFKTGSPINCVSVRNSKILLGCWNGHMIIYNAIDLTRTAVIHNCSSVRSLSINEVYPTFLATNIKGRLSIWNSVKGVKLKEFSNNYQKYPTSGLFSIDGLKCIEYAGNNSQHETVKIWSTAVGYHEKEKKIEDVCCIDSCSNLIVCGTRYGNVILLERDTLKVILAQSVSDAEVTAISFNRTCENGFAVTDYYGTLQLFQIDGTAISLKHKVETIHSRPIKCLIWSSHYLASGSDDCSINVIDVQQRLTNDFMSHINDLFLNSVLDIDIRKSKILASCKDKSIGFFSIKNRLILNHQVQAHDDWVTCVRFISSTSFVSGSNDFSIKIWKITKMDFEDIKNETGKWIFASEQAVFTVLHTLTGHMSTVTSLSFDNQESIASASNDGTIKLWQLKGMFADNIVIDDNNGDLSGQRNPIRWIKFDSKYDTLLALSDDDKIHTFNLYDRDCQVNQLISHKGPVTCVTEIIDTLYTSSVDKSVRKWHFNQILSTKKSPNYRIIDSLNMTNCMGYGDIVVAITDTGLLVFWAYDNTLEIWKEIDTVNVKPSYDRNDLGSICFSSPYLVCESLQKHNENEIDILFSQMTLRYNIDSKAFKKIKSQVPSELNNSDNNCENGENHFIKLVHDGKQRYFLRIKKSSQFLEFSSVERNMEEHKTLAIVPLRGDPCHTSVFLTSKNENICFVGYKQGTVDFIIIKGFCY